jgi:lipoprotein-anchoring transpeptidase ErfK/SrfK
MKSSHRRVSRALVIGVGAIVTLSVVFWLGKLSGSRAAAPAGKNQALRAAAVPLEPSVPAVPPVKPASWTTQPASAEPATTQPSATLLLASNTRIAAAPATQSTAADAARAASATLSASPIADAKAKMDAGKSLEARKILNAAVVSNSLSEADTKTAKSMLNQINAVVVFSSKRFADDEFGGTFTVPPGGVLAKIAESHEVTPELLARINGVTDPTKLRAGKAIKVVNGPFNAVVIKSQFTLELWLGEPGAKGSMYITSYPVGLGKDDSTPTGVWALQNKLKNPAYYSPRGEGVIAGDDPKNPLGEYWIGLTGTDGHAVGKTSYGIHGTIDPTSIGKQESMGCIRLKNEDIERVFEALVWGKSTVTVKD